MKKNQVIALLAASATLLSSLTACEARMTSTASESATAQSAPAYEATADCAEDYSTEAEPEVAEASDEEVSSDYMMEAAPAELSDYNYETAAASEEALAYADEAEYDDYTNGVAEQYIEEEDAEYIKEKSDDEGSYLDDIYGYKKSEKNSGRRNDKRSTMSEEYSELEEKGYKNTLRSPLSTFAADVDTASYSNMRRLINEGYTPDDFPNNSIRVEELINYFSYDYNEPKGKEPFGVTTALGDCPWNEEAKLLSIGLKTEDIDFEDTPPSNFVFLIDVSGSMFSDDKLPLLQDAFSMLAKELDEKDRVSIVTYAGEDSVVLYGAHGDDHRTILRAIQELEAGGSTNGSAGIITAYELASKYYIEGGNNRVILATDGDLNVGLTSTDELERLITREKESGVFLSVLGFGTGNLKDNKLETLADKGNGNYSYIDSIQEAHKVLVEELSANMLTVAKDVKFQVEFNPDVVYGYRLVGYTNRQMKARDFNDDTKDGGEIGAGHTVTALYELILDEGYSDKLLDLNIRYKRPDADESELLVYPVSIKEYKKNQSDDFKFQSAVAEFGLVASRSEYMMDSNLEDVISILDETKLNDEYKQEFYELVMKTLDNSYRYEW